MKLDVFLDLGRNNFTCSVRGSVASEEGGSDLPGYL